MHGHQFLHPCRIKTASCMVRAVTRNTSDQTLNFSQLLADRSILVCNGVQVDGLGLIYIARGMLIHFTLWLAKGWNEHINCDKIITFCKFLMPIALT